MRTRAALSSLAANNRSCAAPIKRVGICGAGAMGAIYAHHFSKAPQFETLLVASGDRASTLRDTPWIINGHAHSLSTSGGVAVLDPQQAEAAPPLDLLVVAVKHQHLEQAIEEVAPLVDRTHTTILSVMNGLDSEERLMARFGEEAVLYCIALAMDSVRNGREVRYENAGRLSFGRADNSVEDERVVRVRDALNAAGVANETPVQMLKEMWWKFMVNVGVNQATAVLQLTYGELRARPQALRLMAALQAEVIAVSQPAGVRLGEPDLARWRRVFAELGDEQKTSMLQDVEAGRPTEAELFAGKVVRLGEQYGVPTPTNRAVYEVLRVMTSA